MRPGTSCARDADDQATHDPIQGAALQRLSSVAWRRGRVLASVRAVPEEVAVSLTYNGGSYAVMMATPADLEDFALGFSLSEGVVDASCGVDSIEVIASGLGIELRMWLATEPAKALRDRRKYLAGPTGCGLCGIEGLSEARRVPPRVSSQATLTPDDVLSAVAALAPHQRLNAATRAVHAAAYWSNAKGLELIREDVGRHNALDKLGGAMACACLDAARGALILSSRVSVEMVQKAARFGFPIIIAVSAPTALAIETAAAADVTLIGVAREDGFEVFTRPQRILADIAG